MLIKVGPQSKFSQLHPTVRLLLERSAPVMIDKDAMEYLVQKVRQSNPDEFADDGITDEQINERGFNLLTVILTFYR